MNTTLSEQIQAIQRARRIIERWQKGLENYPELDNGLNDAGSTIAALNLTKGIITEREKQLEEALRGVLRLKPILGADEEYYNMPEHQGEGEAVYKMFQTIESLLE